MAPKFLEEKLQKEYGKDSDVPYKVMNKLGVMHGNKETAKGKREEKKHEGRTRKGFSKEGVVVRKKDR
jgi:hypothetical protein